MKPCSISMQAFGPYLQKTVIDFTALYPYGIFLITGPTGCGKTTILDAISYALYGRASGSLRDVRDMRSSSAPDALKTAVCFEMALGADRYRFERVMAIRTVKKRSGEDERVTDYEESCSVRDGDSWRLLCTGTQVRDRAVELLGFSHEQFSQVVVLPQGEFRRLLTAPSLEKQKILEALFGTVRWQVFSRALSQRAKAVNGELTECLARTAALCESAQCESPDAVATQKVTTADALKAAEEGQKALIAVFNAAAAVLRDADALEKQFTEYDTVREKLGQLAKRVEEIAQKREALALAEKAQTVAPYFDAAEKADKALEVANSGVQAALAAQTEAQAEQSRAQTQLATYADGDARLRTLSGEAARLEGVLAPASALKEADAELEEGRKRLQTARAAAEQHAVRLVKLTEANAVRKERLEALERGFIAQLPELVAQKSSLEKRAETFAALAAQQKAAKILNASLEVKRAEYKQLAQTCRHEKQIYEQMQQAFEEDAAFRLAVELRDGTPCPVCGSTAHPSPAQAVAEHSDAQEGGTPLKEELETQKQIVAQLEEQQSRSAEEGARVRGECDAAMRRLAELEKDCETAGGTWEETTAALAEATRALTNAQVAAKEKQALEAEQRADEKALTEAREQADRQKVLADQVANTVSVLEGRAKQLTEAVPEELRDLTVLTARIADLKAQYDKLSRNIKEAGTAASEAQSTLAGAEARMRAAVETRGAAEKAGETAHEDCRRSLLDAGLPPDTPVRRLLLEQAAREAIRAELDGYARESYLQKERAAALEKQLVGLTRPDIAALRAREGQARGEMERALAQKGSLEEKLKSLNDLLDQLAQTATHEQKLRRDFALYDHISRLTGGDNPLKTPIQQFVLGLMLDDIVVSANLHLSQLSRGRYTLVRTAQPTRGGGTKGLDLSVGDAWSGGERGVSTLSGGELFLASLSLAFGLSDVVQAYAGGIRLDSLFIDEGFGTLDAETLDTAMGALERLRLSGRLVGVISHVDELGERIPAHIEVQRAGGAGQSLAAQELDTQASATAIVKTP